MARASFLAASRVEPMVCVALILLSFMTLVPNKSPEPTAVGAGSSAVAVHAAGRRWAQLFSLGIIRTTNL